MHRVLGFEQPLSRPKSLLKQLPDQLWNLDQATTNRQFGQRLRRFYAWAAQPQIESEKVCEKRKNLKAKALQFQVADDFPEADRPSTSMRK